MKEIETFKRDMIVRDGMPCDDVSLISHDISTNTAVCMSTIPLRTHTSGCGSRRSAHPAATLACHTWHSRTERVDWERDGLGMWNLKFIFISNVLPISYKVYLRGIRETRVKSRSQPRMSGLRGIHKDIQSLSTYKCKKLHSSFYILSC